MANKDDYLAVYQRFFECFAQTVNPNDQLPVKLASYKLMNLEVVGGIIDWTTQYLTQKQCPSSLLAPLIKIIIEEIRKNCKKNPIGCGYNTTAEVYEPLKLMQAVMAKTNEICLRYRDNSMLCSLPTPGPPHYVISVAAIKNTRRKMEDRHVVIHDLNTMFNIQEASPSSYYAIFDGHAGHDAAAYSAVHLHQFLAESKYFVNNPEQALIDAFYKTDALFIDKEEFCSGTTAVCALLKPKERILYIAWVGDSQALIVSKGVLYQCVVPHKPGREDEKDRIEQQGGEVVYWGTWRVNGQLAVSRAIGDREYKPYVTAIPEVQEIPVTANSDFIILACDGLWDYLSEKDAATTVYNMVCTNSDDTDPISHRLIQLAKKQGSTDNISVIVVFLREPAKVAADAHWANRNTTTSLLPTNMETGLDNANAATNPFANSNGAEILQQKDDFLLNQPKDDFLLNLTEGFKQNGGAITSPTANNLHFSNFDMNASNGKRQSVDEFDEDEDMGPETDVDAVDDIPSPLDVKQMIFHQDSEENQKDNEFNPFTIEEKGSFEVDVDLELQKQQSSEFDVQESMREETPTPPADKVHEATVEENVADSAEESEDEWNYFKGSSAAAETSSSSLKTDQEVAELTKTIEEDEEQDMSQLNPNAAEFVPISSPTRNISSPACRALIGDQVLAQSPRCPTPSNTDIKLPNPVEFESEVKNRPSEVFNNGHDNENGHKLSTQEVMENLLNGKNLDEIEFYPSTPSKIMNPSPEEFHFGPNATPFSTPAKPLDQSEALSTKAIFGDESTASYLEGKTLEGTMLIDSSSPTEKEDSLSLLKLKEQDPMSMSFYQDENEHNPFDLNQVQQLPENIDDFISGVENGEDNKENLNPEVLNDDLLGVSQLPITPEPDDFSESLKEKQDVDIEKICDLPPAVSPSLEEIAKQPLPITPEPTEVIEDEIKEEREVEETDLCKFSESSPINADVKPLTADLIKTDESNADVICDIKKISEMDSSPETEELSQISDAADEVPPLCKTPEITSDLDQFVSDIKEVIQEVCQTIPTIEDVVKTIHDFGFDSDVKSKEDEDEIEKMVEETNIDDDGIKLDMETSVDDDTSKMVTEIKTDDDVSEMVTETKVDDVISDMVIETKVDDIASELVMETKVDDVPSGMVIETKVDDVASDMVIEAKVDDVASEMVVETKVDDVANDMVTETKVADNASEVIETKVDDVASELVVDTKADSETNKVVVESNMYDDTELDDICKMVTKTNVEEETSKILVELNLIEDKLVIETKTDDNIDKMEIETDVDKVEVLPQLEEPDTEVCQILTSTKVDDHDLLVHQKQDEEFEMKLEQPIDIAECGLMEPLEKAEKELTFSEKEVIEDIKGPVEVHGTSEEEKSGMNDVCELEPTPQKDHGEDLLEPTEPKLPLTPEPSNEISPVQEDVDIEVAIGEPKSEDKISDDLRDLDSPMEDVTTSIKDDISTSEIIEEAKDISTEKGIVIQDSFIMVSNEPVLETYHLNITEQLIDASQSVIEDKAVETTTEPVKSDFEESCEILERSNVPEILSPLSPATQPLDSNDIALGQTNTELEQTSLIELRRLDETTHIPTSMEIKDVAVTEEETKIELKTEVIIPQYPEEAILITPSEETKEDVTTTTEPEKQAETPLLPEIIKSSDSNENVISAAAIGTTAAVAAAAAVGVAAVTKTKERKSIDKKPAAKKLTSAKPPTTLSTSSKPAPAKTTPKTSTSKSVSSPTKSTASPLKTTTAKTLTSKVSSSTLPMKTSPKVASTKTTPKADLTPISKITEKKTAPLTNGDIKGPAKGTMLTKKTSTGPKTSTSLTKPASAKASPTKVEAPKSAPKSLPKSTTATRTTTLTAKPRPLSLTPGSAGGTTKSATTAKSTVTKTTTTTTSPKTATAPSKMRPVSAPLAKPKLAPLGGKPKAPDTEKQIKDTVNKQLTSTRTTTTATKTTATSRITNTSTVKKTETKAPTTTRTTTTTKTTTIKATKKPAEITRLANKAKPATTKAITKPQQNGTAEHVTTVVQETTTILTTEPQLVKDLSPIENKFIIDNSQVTESNVAD